MNTTRKCSKCKLEKALIEENFYSDPTRKHGFRYLCKPCTTFDRKDHEMKRVFKRYYNTTYEAVLAIVEELDYTCPICKQKAIFPLGTRKDSKKKRFFVVDHNKDTGENRGVICNLCNCLVGYAAHDVHTLAAAIDYLKQCD